MSSLAASAPVTRSVPPTPPATHRDSISCLVDVQLGQLDTRQVLLEVIPKLPVVADT